MGSDVGADLCSFFFQAEDGIRDLYVTGVQTCALPICARDQGVEIIGHAVVREIAPGDREIGCGAAVEPAKLVELLGRECSETADLRSVENDRPSLPVRLLYGDKIFSKHEFRSGRRSIVGAPRSTYGSAPRTYRARRRQSWARRRGRAGHRSYVGS